MSLTVHGCHTACSERGCESGNSIVATAAPHSPESSEFSQGRPRDGRVFYSLVGTHKRGSLTFLGRRQSVGRIVVGEAGEHFCELGTWTCPQGIERLRTEEQVHISRPNIQTTAYE
jgi:hypothetical protein